ncbi:MAG TPA: D-glycero-beta-D-manno-heptose 1-phosphate adenylyltransferase [Candidatus Ozemobacteraceae bacterium]|nr:D-glycero-beta-D-manno-heptose 1-phosphate adenylyltransferase [Candidatus Ozemobacteraceae bacterium]
MRPDSLFHQDLTTLCRLVASDLDSLNERFSQALAITIDALRAGRKVLAFGNGGSACDAEHLAAELVGRFGYDRASLPGIALTIPSATFSAIANDYGYEQVFARQIEGLAQSGDVAIGFSTSGKSPNVLRALQTARIRGVKTIVMTGAKDSPCAEAADVCLRAPSASTPRIQEIHAVLVHSLCRGVEEALFPKPDRTSLPSDKVVNSARLSEFALAIKPYDSVFTNGCFDILHPGHVTYLQQARRLGELLIVGVNSDDSVRRLKGPQRPYHRLEDRLMMLSALQCIDYVVAFDEETPQKLIETLTPRVLVKGGDYSRDTVVGADWVEKHGGQVKIVPLVEGHSTTRILEKTRHG